MQIRRVETRQLGAVWLGATARGLARVQIGGDGLREPGAEESAEGKAAARHLDAAEKALKKFVGGDGAAFDGLTLDVEGMTDFQREVYEALRQLPAGETCTYGALAAMVGRPGAARAIGRAMATNPLPLAIPCHRVLGSTGKLHGYSADGRGCHNLDLKQQLLDLEARPMPSAQCPVHNAQ